MCICNDWIQDELYIDLVLLIDVILVLIIFFVVIIMFDVCLMLQVQLLMVSQQNSVELLCVLSVLVNVEGCYFINDQEVLCIDVELVKQIIVVVVGIDCEQIVLLCVDVCIFYQVVVIVQDVFGQFGFWCIVIVMVFEVCL